MSHQKSANQLQTYADLQIQTVQAYGNDMKLDLRKLQQHHGVSRTQTERYRSGGQATPSRMVDHQGSPIVLNSYSSIYKQRESSKQSRLNVKSNSRNSLRQHQLSVNDKRGESSDNHLLANRMSHQRPLPDKLPSTRLLTRLSSSFCEAQVEQPSRRPVQLQQPQATRADE